MVWRFTQRLLHFLHIIIIACSHNHKSKFKTPVSHIWSGLSAGICNIVTFSLQHRKSVIPGTAHHPSVKWWHLSGAVCKFFTCQGLSANSLPGPMWPLWGCCLLVCTAMSGYSFFFNINSDRCKYSVAGSFQIFLKIQPTPSSPWWFFCK